MEIENFDPQYFVIDVNSLSTKQELIMNSIKSFFSEDNINTILPILMGNTKISLRIIDWFVTNYSKKNNINYILSKNNDNILFNVFINYKLQLKAYTKKQFDPFCRRNRINFYFDETEFITTTVGQLNFFRWALLNNVIDYIITNYKEIEFDMNENTKKSKLEKLSINKSTNSLNNSSEDTDELSNNSNDNSDESVEIHNLTKTSIKKRKKRKPLSVAATNNMNKNNQPVLLSFD